MSANNRHAQLQQQAERCVKATILSIQSRVPFNTCAEVVVEEEDCQDYQEHQEDEEEEEDEKIIYKLHVSLNQQNQEEGRQ